MKKVFVLPIIVLLAFSAQEGPGKIKWVHDYEAALKTAKEQGKPIMLYFGWKG